MPTPTLDELPAISVSYNLIRDLSSRDIGLIREGVTDEVRRCFCFGEQRAGDPERVVPFGTGIIETKTETEPRLETMIQQLEISLRYIDEMLEIDLEICGLAGGQSRQDNKEQNFARSAGIKMQLHQVHQRGRKATIVTQNSWGSTDYSDKNLQKELKDFMMLKEQIAAEKRRNLAETENPAATSGNADEDYDQVLAQLLSHKPDKQYDIQVLSEDDRVDIFSADDEHMGTATVREARGNMIQLHVNGQVRLHKDCYLRRKSNRRSLETYKAHVFAYCRRLGIDTHLTDRRGAPYDCGFGHDVASLSVEYAFTPAEQVFFGIDQGDLDDDVEKQMQDRNFSKEDVPRGLLTDTEQSVAFALGAMGHPCYLIQGPPGTGKTTVAGHLVRYLSEQGLKTLVCSHSNRGLDVLLTAIKKRGPNIHRGGTEEGVCAKQLREHFIRRDLIPPNQSDYLKKELDHQAWRAAIHAYNHAGADCPQVEDYRKDVIDKDALWAAWQEFHRKKIEIINQLSQEDGLVAGVTLNSLISDEIIGALGFDVVIVDEASRGYIFELLPALQKAGKQIIFIGDHKQLSNVVLPEHFTSFLADQPSKDGDRESNIGSQDTADFTEGPFAFMAERTSIPQVMLRTNRRSLPGIVEMVSRARYDGKLMAGKYDPEDPSNPGAMTWVDTASRSDRFETQMGVSKGNHLEARLMARRIIEAFLQGDVTDDNFGLISMYSGQRNLVLEKIRKHPFAHDYQRDQLLNLLHGNHGTVDSFQGTERERILCSLTSSNDQGTIGHTKELDRINVAISRAQEAITLIGDSSTVIDNNPDSQSAALYTVIQECIAKHGRIIDTFPELAAEAIPEEDKSQTYNARRNRYRSQRRKQKKNVHE